MKYLAACCTVKNESPNILEWISFHKAVGFEHLIIIDNGSSDGTADVISSFRDRSYITVIPWKGQGTQIDMMNWALSTYRHEFFWCAFIDCDEYLYPSQVGDIKNLLTEYEAFGALGVHWLIYGSSGHKTRPRGMTIESYTRRCENDFVFNGHVKCIVKMSSAREAVTSHIFKTVDGVVDENKTLLPLTEPYGFFANKKPTFERFRLNHYHTRSRQDYDIKADRGYFGVDDAKLRDLTQRNAMFNQHDRNEVDDRSAIRYKILTKFYMNANIEVLGRSYYEKYSLSEAKLYSFFDVGYYLFNNPDVAANSVNPLKHYLEVGWREGRNPCAFFDTNAYIAANPDVQAAGVPPLVHYLLHGIREGRTIHAVSGSRTMTSKD